MKIKDYNNPLIPRNVRGLLSKQKRLAFWIFGLGGAVASAILFFAVFNYGGYLYKSGQTQHYKQLLKDLAALDFSFIKNYAEGQFAEFDEVKIDMKFKHMLRIHYLREEATKGKYIDNALKDEEFPAKLSYNGKTHDVKISLTGKVARTHLGNPEKWSFQVKVKGDDTIEGMKRFGILVPTARGNLTDWLSFELMKERELMGLRVDYVTVSINGKSGGVFYMEERFDKHLVENNSLREGILFKLEKDISPYKESKLMADPGLRKKLLMMRRMWQDVMAGNLPAEKFFDMKKMAVALVVSDLMNNRHPLSKANIRFYFNPVTNLAEPIAREFEDIGKSDPATMNMFLEKPEIYSRQFWLSQELIIGIIRNNREFQRHYIQEAALMSQKKFLDEFFKSREDKIKVIQEKVYRTWPYYKLPTEQMYANQEYIRSKLFPDTDEVAAWIKEGSDDQLSVYLQNLQYLPVEVAHISLGDSEIFYPEKPIVLGSKAKAGNERRRSYTFRTPEGFSWPEEGDLKFKLHYNMLGLQAGDRTVSVSPRPDFNPLELASEIRKEANYEDFAFIKEEDNTLSIPAGQWTLSEDLVIPDNKRLEIKAGANINLLNQAKIITYSPVYALGNEAQPVRIYSSDASGEGLLVIEAGRRSNLSYVNFEQLAASETEDRSFNGALTFYKSPVDFTACNFSGSRKGDDFLQIIRSDVFMDRCQFVDINADAFDCDFCTGTISNSSLAKIGKNGLDFSASELKLSKVLITHIGNKGISAGEDSEISARWLDIRNAGIGLASIDRSSIDLLDAQLLNNQIGLVLYQSDPKFGPASVSGVRLDVKQSKTPYLIEKNSRLILDGTTQMGDQAGVEDMLNEAGKEKISQ